MISVKTGVFALVFLAGMGGLLFTCLRLYRFMKIGRPDVKLDRLGDRVISVLVYWLGQKKVAEKTMDKPPVGFTSKHHLMIFWGFLIVTIGTVEVWFNGFTGLDFSFLPSAIFIPLRWTVDVFNLIVLLAVGFGFFRRIVVKPRLIPMSNEAIIILGAIAGLMLTHFGFHAFRMIAAHDLESSAPISTVVAELFYGTAPSTASLVSQVFWWMHVVLGLAFINFVPYSKHIHILGSLPNIFFRKLSERGLMPKLNLEDENDWGVGKIEQFTQKSLMDQYACTECARCSNFCPAFNTDKPLSPMKLIHDLRDEMIERGSRRDEIAKLEKAVPEAEREKAIEGAPGVLGLLYAAKKAFDDMPAMVGGRIHDETLWACTTCGACQEVCPVFIDHPLKILQMRTHLTLVESRIPSELTRTFSNLEKNSNPWGIASERRMEWAEGLTVPTIEENPSAEYLLFVGCAGAFDDRIKKTMRAFVEVLQIAEVSFAVLGKQESCSGDTARRGGNEYLFQSQAEANVTLMNEAKVRKVVASCPHCFHTIKNEYPQFGGKYEVIHHSELLAYLITSGKIKPEEQVAKSYTYHDSCYLGRWNQVYEAPRQILDAVAGAGVAPADAGKVTEMVRSKKHGFCCGGGGARMWMEEKIGTRVNNNRANEIIETGAEAVAVACPFCTIMISDGIKAANADEKIQVLDVAEVIRKSLTRKIPPKAAPAADPSS